MIKLNPYLNFNGNAEEAFNFYKSVFGGEFTSFQRFSDVPSDVPNPGIDEGSKIMHVSLSVGSNVLMGSDVPSKFPSVAIGNNFSISLDTESREEADRYFKALSDGGQVTMPLEKTFWGAYFGMLTDKFGTQWMLNCETGE